MSKHGQSNKLAKHKKKGEQVLESADDFQAAGVEFEEAAGKWRAGDAVKSMRFFTRALEVYNQGLVKHPQSLDLAYNKARVQLEVATHPILVKQLHIPILTALEEALVAHRYALTLDQDNPDTLFNTSQVLTSIAEELANDSTRSNKDALQLLEEALELQNKCLSIQELKFEESQQMQTEMVQPPDDSNSETPENQPTTSTEDQWFTVIEPVTRDTLIDTVLAQLSTLTTMCSILTSNTDSPLSSLAWIETYSSTLLTTKLPQYTADDSTTARTAEISLAKANFSSLLLEVAFRNSRIDAETYRRELDTIFHDDQPPTTSSFEFLLSNATSLISYNTALADHPHHQHNDARPRWIALTDAIAILSKASKLPSPPEDITRTHFLRGDCSLLQARLAYPPTSYDQAIKNRPQLLRNAQIFYGNAGKLLRDEGAEEKKIAVLRADVAGVMYDDAASSSSIDGEKLVEALSTAGRGSDTKWLMEQIEVMVEDGLLPLDS